MGAFNAELLKLKRSLSWPVVVLLPISLVLMGAATQLAQGGQPDDGWHTVWVQSVGFYGLFPLATGIAIIGSLVWRCEHRGSNWNALMSGPTPTLHIVVAKGLVIAGLTAIMQVVLLISVILMGKLGFGLPGMLPGQYVGITVLLALMALPIAFLQSALSMLIRSFAAPIAVALVASGISVVALNVVGDAALASPYALVTRTALLGTGTFSDPGSVTAGDLIPILAAAVFLVLALVVASTVILERRDTRV